MANSPEFTRIYHVTHVNNLKSVLELDALYSDAHCKSTNLLSTSIGMQKIKKRRLLKDVICWPPTKVGEYVPFNFCPRSVMLYVISRQNRSHMTYVGGRDSVVHLELDLRSVIMNADLRGAQWALTTINAAASCVEFFTQLADLERLDWSAVNADNWVDPEVKEAKQAEFLVYREVPVELLVRIGVNSVEVQQQVAELLQVFDV